MSTNNQDYYETLITDQEVAARSYIGHDGQALNLVGYEGSFGCSPPYGQYRENLTEIYNEMASDPRVGPSVTLNLENYAKTVTQDIGNKFSLINVFSYIGWGGQYGDWGHLQYQDDYHNESSNGRYKFDGIVAYLNETNQSKIYY